MRILTLVALIVCGLFGAHHDGARALTITMPCGAPLAYCTCSSDGTTVLSCAFANPSSITSLSFRTQGRRLGPGLFDALTSLTYLDLASSGLTQLPAGIFDNLTSLTQLTLAMNPLTSIPEGIFHRLANLTLLNMGKNALSTVPRGTFDGMWSLDMLDLQLNYVPGPILTALSICNHYRCM
eukprot:Opistho-2@4074